MITGRNYLSYSRIFRPNPLLRCLGGVLLMASCSAQAREYRFSPSSLEGNMLSQQDLDLSLFSKSNAQLPGTYSSRVRVNDRREYRVRQLPGRRADASAYA